MNFNNWILQQSPRKVAKALNVDPTAVCAWQKGKSCPRPEKMRQIKELSQGRVSYDDIINFYLRTRKV